MTRQRAFLILPVLMALSPPTLASAKVDPRFSQADPVIVGDPGGTHEYRVVLRDMTGAPQSGDYAILDFSGTSVRLCDVQEAGVTLNCATRTMWKMTDRAGVALFHPRFGGSCNEDGVWILGSGIVITRVPARSTDVDAIDGCAGLHDFTLFARPFLDGDASHPELDFDNSGGAPSLDDFVLFARDLLSRSKSGYCP